MSEYNYYPVSRKAPEWVRIFLIRFPRKSFLTRSSIIVTTALIPVGMIYEYCTSPENVKPKTNFTEKQVLLENKYIKHILGISPPGFLQFTASTLQVVIFNQPLK